MTKTYFPNCEIAGPSVGSCIKPDGWAISTLLTECTDWEAAPFRLRATRTKINFAVRVEVSGKKIRWDAPFGGAPGVRIKITFVGDGEPDTVTYGWMKV